jgi:hypothetical protein
MMCWELDDTEVCKDWSNAYKKEQNSDTRITAFLYTAPCW